MKKQALILSLLLVSLCVFSQSKERKDLEARRTAILREIESTQKLISENQQTTTNVNTRVNLIKEQIKARSQMLNLIDQEMIQLNQEIVYKERQIRKLEKELQEKKEKYAEILESMYVKRGQSNKLLFILSANDFSQALRRVVYLREHAGYHKQQSEEIAENQTVLEQEKIVLERDREAKQALQAARKKEQDQLMSESSVLTQEVNALKNQGSKMRADLKKKQDEEQEISRQIQRIIAEEIAKAEREEAERRAREEAERKAREAKNATVEAKPEKAQPESKPKPKPKPDYSQTKEEAKLAKNFGENKGKLPFPIKGSYKIINRFGKNQTNTSPLFDYKGIDILTLKDTDALSVFDGEVIVVGVIQGYCRYILVKHGGYYTFYQNLDKIYVKKGDKVKRGQPLGRVYTDVTKGEGTILHFEVHESKKALNPELWLNK
ncbi:peptidoglycan DD-metalloendopeptidase family protein [Bacteroidales bacterium OttesenSCG-928-J19]|nr:peptidoglycan DD-metalloendopeptidase family protein [Bacteroidales bacterium OttesenSCG-928-J19]